MSMSAWSSTNLRKSRLIGFLAVLVLALALVLSLLHPRPAAPVPQQAKFLGFTHQGQSAQTNLFATNYAAFLREWSAAGTNVARFSVTNRQRYALILYPYVGFFDDTNAIRSRYETLLLNAPSGYGIFLQPGQATTVEVAVLPGKGPGRVRFGYTPDYKHAVPRTIELMRGLVSPKPAGFHTEWFFSDRTEP
jgi:hypothetical protein